MLRAGLTLWTELKEGCGPGKAPLAWGVSSVTLWAHGLAATSVGPGGPPGAQARWVSSSCPEVLPPFLILA